MKLYETDVNVSRGLFRAIDTQTSDVGEEINGGMTYDRNVDIIDEELVQEVNRKLQEYFHEAVKLKE